MPKLKRIALSSEGSTPILFSFKQNMEELIGKRLELPRTLRHPPYHYSLINFWWETPWPRLKRFGIPVQRVIVPNREYSILKAKEVLLQSLADYRVPRTHKRSVPWYGEEFYLYSENSRYQTRQLWGYLWYNDQTGKNEYRLICGEDIARYQITGEAISDVPSMFANSVCALYVDDKFVHLLSTIHATTKLPTAPSLATMEHHRVGLRRFTHQDFITLVNTVSSNVRRRL